MAVKKKKKRGPQGGKRPGAGRKKGGTNKFSVAALEKATAEGYLPLDYLLRVMRDARCSKPRRDWAAAQAAPYLHHKLSSVEMTGKKGGPIQMIAEGMTAKEAAEAYASTLQGQVYDDSTGDPVKH